jgi:hypothetical protein
MSTVSDLQGFIRAAKAAREPEIIEYNRLDAEIKRRRGNGESNAQLSGLLGALETARQAVESYDREIADHQAAINREGKPSRR